VVISDFEDEKPNESIRENIERNQKVAVVTGSSSGIGYATALRLARSGYVTFATMRNHAKGSDLIKVAENEKLPVHVEQLDITDIDSIKDFMGRIGESVGRINVLVNNAGCALIGSLEDLSIKEIQDQLNTNLLGTIHVTQQVLPVMRAKLYEFKGPDKTYRLALLVSNLFAPNPSSENPDISKYTQLIDMTARNANPQKTWVCCCCYFSCLFFLFFF
jgi:NAD(P)-dependent dehydrogenase (short-subunit alcohol dehydrogenase family)